MTKRSSPNRAFRSGSSAFRAEEAHHVRHVVQDEGSPDELRVARDDGVFGGHRRREDREGGRHDDRAGEEEGQGDPMVGPYGEQRTAAQPPGEKAEECDPGEQPVVPVGQRRDAEGDARGHRPTMSGVMEEGSERQERQRQKARHHRLGDAVVGLPHEVRHALVGEPRQPRAEGRPCHAPGEGIHADTAEGPLNEEAGVVGSHGSAHQVHRQGDDGAHHVDEPQGAAARPVEQISVNRPLSRHQAVGHEAVAPDVVPDVVARMPDRQGGRTREHGTHLPQGESDKAHPREDVPARCLPEPC